MTKTKRVISLVICLTMAITALFSTSLTVSAATSGGSNSATITVKSKSNYWYPGSSSITLKQEKQTLTYKALNSNKTKTKPDIMDAIILLYTMQPKTKQALYIGVEVTLRKSHWSLIVHIK